MITEMKVNTVKVNFKSKQSKIVYLPKSLIIEKNKVSIGNKTEDKIKLLKEMITVYVDETIQAIKQLSGINQDKLSECFKISCFNESKIYNNIFYLINKGKLEDITLILSFIIKQSNDLLFALTKIKEETSTYVKFNEFFKSLNQSDQTKVVFFFYSIIDNLNFIDHSIKTLMNTTSLNLTSSLLMSLSNILVNIKNSILSLNLESKDTNSLFLQEKEKEFLREIEIHKNDNNTNNNIIQDFNSSLNLIKHLFKFVNKVLFKVKIEYGVETHDNLNKIYNDIIYKQFISLTSQDEIISQLFNSDNSHIILNLFSYIYSLISNNEKQLLDLFSTIINKIFKYSIDNKNDNNKFFSQDIDNLIRKKKEGLEQTVYNPLLIILNSTLTKDNGLKMINNIIHTYEIIKVLYENSFSNDRRLGLIFKETLIKFIEQNKSLKFMMIYYSYDVLNKLSCFDIEKNKLDCTCDEDIKTYFSFSDKEEIESFPLLCLNSLISIKSGKDHSSSLTNLIKEYFSSYIDLLIDIINIVNDFDYILMERLYLKRVSSGKINVNNEFLFYCKLKSILGTRVCFNLGKLINETGDSNKIFNAFHNNSKNNISVLPIHTNYYQKETESLISNYNISSVLNNFWENYKQTYRNRKLYILQFSSLVHLRFNRKVLNKSKNNSTLILINLLYAEFLILFNSKQMFDINYVKEKLNIKSSDLSSYKAKLQLLVKVGILKIDNNENSSLEVFSLNQNFINSDSNALLNLFSLLPLKINKQINNTNIVQPNNSYNNINEIHQDTQASILRNLDNILNCLIVKCVKQNKDISKSMLLKNVIESGNRMKLNTQALEYNRLLQRLENLISKEFISASTNSSETTYSINN